jgi:nitrate reductase assembly molybdenum cofactor insertion protein NarJ
MDSTKEKKQKVLELIRKYNNKTDMNETLLGEIIDLLYDLDPEDVDEVYKEFYL